MRSNYLKEALKTAVLAVTILLLGVGVSMGQTVSLTAAPSQVQLPDGSIVPMWGYTCGAVTLGASCAPLNPNAGLNWSPVLITVPYSSTGTSLTVGLTNNLTFVRTNPAPDGNSNTVPTSLVIVGQLGGGLGLPGGFTTAPDHSLSQQVTWPIASTGTANTPPTQGNRVQSFGTEVPEGATAQLPWTNLRPGTYLIESGTHPSIQGPMGLYGILVVTTAPGTSIGSAYPGVTAANYNAEVSVLFSEIDPVQNRSVQAAVTTVGFTEDAVWSGQPTGCGNPASSNYRTCYPPTVNYSPLYYLVNGVAFDKTHAAGSFFVPTPAPAANTPITGTLLVRMVNAGVKMHVPSIVGALTQTPAVPGFGLIAEDGNPLPGTTRVQSEVFMSAGKTYDVMVNVPAANAATCTAVSVTPCTGTPLPIFDRELSLSGNAIGRDAGMLAYIGVNGAGLPAAPSFAAAQARNDSYSARIAGQTFTISDPAQGVIANDTNVYGVQLLAAPTHGTVTLNSNGTFKYVADGTPTPAGGDIFTYCANGSVTAAVCSSGIFATVAVGGASIEAAGGIHLNPDLFTSNLASHMTIAPPGVLANDYDDAGYRLSAVTTGLPTWVTLSADGSFTADNPGSGSVTCPGTVPTGTQCYSFSYSATNSQGTASTTPATTTVVFLPASNLTVAVKGADGATLTDYRWVIEEDRTFYVDPTNTATGASTTSGADCSTNPAACTVPPTFGTNFHTSYMPLVATGCAGGSGAVACETGQMLLGQPAVCDIGNGVCRTTAAQQTSVDPKSVYLDPKKRYYISVLPGDAANSFQNTNSCLSNPTPSCGHGMGGAPIAPGQTNVTILVQPNPFPPSKLSVFVFEDDFPLNGEQDGGGGIDVLSPNEPGLGGFNITLFDDAGGTGDATGQMTYDMFNQPLANSLSGTVDPSTGVNACPISKSALVGVDSANGNQFGSASPTGITGTIVTCPKYEADGTTLSPLAGQAVVANLMPGRYGVVATPAADRIARGEEWLQTNTLDGQKAHDSFLRIGEPSFFQEYGPAGYHVSIGFANPSIIQARLPNICRGTDPNITERVTCNNTVRGKVTTERMSRTPDERLYSSGTNDSFAFTQCFVSVGDADGEDFAFTKCDSNGNFVISGLPNGDWRITVFDQWNDMLVDGLSTPVRLGNTTAPFCPGSGSTSHSCNMGDIAMNQWQANIYTRTLFDADGNGVSTRDLSGVQCTGNNVPAGCNPNYGNETEAGLALVATNIRFRDGSYSNFNNTDLNGYAGFNEVFPLFSWYVVETDTTRYKSTGIHVVYDAGGPADDGPGCGGTGNSPCAPSPHTISSALANSYEALPLPGNQHFPGSVYCNSADCKGQSIKSGPNPGSTPNSTSRIDPPWVTTEGWQGFSGQNSFIEFGKAPYQTNENGGIHGEVIYASTRPFDDPALLIHTSWTPDVPGVTINLYQETTDGAGVQTLKMVDTTKTTSWDDWAQGFRSDGTPNMNCPGQGRDSGTDADLFFFTLYNQPMWLDYYNNVLHGSAAAAKPLPLNSQFKCFDGMHNWNQVQPAPYDGMYQFPSVVARNPVSGAPAGSGSTNGTPGALTGTNCTICTADPADNVSPMLPPGKYVVEMIVPPGYELVKEEDKNILIGDNYIAPETQQFGGLGSVFILPDQAEISSNPGNCDPTLSPTACNFQQATQSLGRTTLPSGEGDTGSIEQFWPCVGALRTVPDYISLFPGSGEVSPFAGATRNLCDRKEVTLTDQASVLAKFWVFTSAHVAAHFTGVITDDFTSEFDPFSPQFGEKFSPPNLPISIKDWSGTEISRVYSDQWGTYNGLNYSTWEVNPPNPTGYAPTMMVTCMNDPGPIPDPARPGQMMTDPLYNPQYSQFCYEIPFMPGQTQYMDTPVVPTSAFAGAGYNNPDCAYPDTTPAIGEVDGDGAGPWVAAGGAQKIYIHALGAQMVPNNAYSGPSATASPFNQKKVTRTYHFGTAAGTVKIGGTVVPSTNVTWGDTEIDVAIPSGFAVLNSACPIQQQTQYGGSPAVCGQLDLVTSTGQKSIDTVTVTIGGKTPTHVAPTASIQAAIDNANPGDLIIVDPTCTPTAGLQPACPAPAAGTAAPPSPAAHNELLIMWKPVRLQGVGAASSVINANTQPAGKLNDWRARVDCLFGLAPSGSPKGYSSACGSGWTAFNPSSTNPQIDRLPLEATVGWDATLNGNLAELLQEPTLMGALEGAAITVLAKGVNFPSDPFAADTFPTGTPLLNGSTNSSIGCGPNTASAKNPFPSNFLCNPSSIDGLGIQDSSQGGGGIFVHAWGHDLQISNNRINNNSGTLSGGINVGQGEFPGAYLGGVGAANADPGSCQSSAVTNLELPYCFNLNVNLHNNSISSNSSTGDELFSATPAGAGGVSITTGSDFYKFQNNWVCGNLSTGDGGGFGHIGFIYDGDIEHNTFLFNQSTNPTIPANGGGLVIMGAPDVDPTCGATTDQDCVPTPGSVGPSDGTGPGLVINANLIMGNSADSGTGGGIQFQAINGSDVVSFPNTPANWNSVLVTNNIIANNVSGWDGAGVALLDGLNVRIINNTIISNDSTASSGVLFNTLGGALASTQGPTCTTGCGNNSAPQIAGLVSIQNSSVLAANLPSGVTCPSWDTANHCRTVSFPLLANDVIFKNRSFHIGVGALGLGTTNQQAVVTLLNAVSNTTVTSQSTTDAITANGAGQIITGGTGACVSGVTYWDLGVRGDTAANNHASGVTLAPSYSFLTSTTGYTGSNNSQADPTVFSEYCNGSRTPPEFKSLGYQVPPGISDATVPNPVFNLTPAATVDEGNNWINLSWGPLALTNATNNTLLGNYGLAAGSPAIDYIPSTATTNYAEAPSRDFFDNPRKVPANPCVDVGAVDVAGTTGSCAGGGGGGGGGPVIPTLTVLDDFNRAAALNLNTGAPAGVAWNSTAVGILDQTTGNTSTGVAQTLLPGSAYWAGTVNLFGPRQAAAFTFASAPITNTGLALKVTGGTATAPTSYVRVRYTTGGGGTITIATTTNGTAFTTATGGTLTGFGNFATGDTLTAMVDATGVVNVWKTRGGTVTFIGTATLPNVAAWTTGGGRIGMLPGVLTGLDNFAGGNVP